jgi:two-component system, NarL family, sensor kinase
MTRILRIYTVQDRIYFVTLQTMKKFSIRERLILYFVVMGVLSIAVVSLFSIYEAKKGIIHRTFSQLILLRDLRSEQILAFFETRSNELKSLANSEEIREIAIIIGRKDNSDTTNPITLKNKHLFDLVADTNFSRSLYYISDQGNAYIFSPEEPDPVFNLVKMKLRFDASVLAGFINTPGRPDHITFEQAGQEHALQIFTAVPVYDQDGNYYGSLVSEMQPEAVYRILYNKDPGTGLGETGEAYLVGPDQRMRSPSRFVPDAIMNVKVKTEGFLKAADGMEGLGIYKDYRGIAVLGAYGSFETGGLTRIILAEIDSDEAMVPLNAIRNEILFLSLIIGAAIFIVAWVVAYGITRPLVRLKNAANFIALGNYNQQLEVAIDDEIGELTRAFNAMAQEINSTTQELKENEERLHHYYRANLDGQDIERQRLSRELHDGLGQQLVAGKLMLEGSLYTEGTDLKQKITEAQGIFDQIIGDIRRISHDLSPSILQEFGLKAAMENLCNNFMKTSGIHVDVFLDLYDVKPDEMTSTYLFRISQEGLNNIQRHSGATEVKVVLSKAGDEILLEIEDNGCGFRIKEVSKRGGNGLYNIRERVNILKGNLTIKSCPGQGTKIQIRIPFNNL